VWRSVKQNHKWKGSGHRAP